jgi:hypothetical protein
MQAELTASGFQDLHSAEAVENAMKAEGDASCSELCMWLLQEMHVQELK